MPSKDDPNQPYDIDNPNIKNKRPTIGPVRSSAHIKVNSRFDYAPDICKDYYETGYCTFGDACKFMHTREDYKTGWQVDKDWEEEQKKRSYCSFVFIGLFRAKHSFCY
jgi:hypothetical protein